MTLISHSAEVLRLSCPGNPYRNVFNVAGGGLYKNWHSGEYSFTISPVVQTTTNNRLITEAKTWPAWRRAYRTARGYANLRTAKSQTGQLAEVLASLTSRRQSHRDWETRKCTLQTVYLFSKYSQKHKNLEQLATTSCQSASRLHSPQVCPVTGGGTSGNSGDHHLKVISTLAVSMFFSCRLWLARLRFCRNSVVDFHPQW